MSAFEASEFQTRIEKLQKIIAESGLDGALIFQRTDLLYYTGTAFQGVLAIPANGESKLFIWRGAGRFTKDFPVAKTLVRGIGKLPSILQTSEFANWKHIGIEEDVLPVSIYKGICQRSWSDGQFSDVAKQIRTQRSVKSEAELNCVRDSGDALVSGFKALPDIIREGIPEYEVQAQMDVIMRRAGDQSFVRARGFNTEAIGVVAFGPTGANDNAFDGPICQPGRSPFAPMGGGDRLIEHGLPVIVDVTAAVHGYTTDMTRCYSLGELDSRFIDAHDFCVAILNEVTKRLIPGAIPEELYLWALEEAEKAGYADVFMNTGQNKVRFLAHGIGIEMDEWPVLAKRFTAPLEENMVIALDPKIIFKDGSVGVEDTIIVKSSGPEVVTEMVRGIIFV